MAEPYVTADELKLSLAMEDITIADDDVANAVEAASRLLDELTGRRFWLDEDNTSERIFDAFSAMIIQIDDCVDVQSVKVDRNGDGTFEETWTTTSYMLEPANAIADGKPYEAIRVRRNRGVPFQRGEQTVKVTGQFGWAAVPGDIKVATSILAARYVLRVRQAPFGIVMFYAEGSASGASRIARNDPDVAPIIAKYSRHRPFA